MEEQEMLRVQREQQERIEKLHILNRYAEKGQILFVGSSLMEQFPVNEILMTKGLFYKIYNRGVSGFTTADMLNHMDTMVFDLEPSRIFINIGTNDIGAPGYSEDALLSNYRRILARIKERLSEAEVYVMAYYPVNETDKLSRCAQGRAPLPIGITETLMRQTGGSPGWQRKWGCTISMSARASGTRRGN